MHCKTSFIADDTRDKALRVHSGMTCQRKFSARAEFFADGTRALSKSKTIIARNPIDQSSLSRNNYHTTGAENYIGKVFQRF